MVHSLLPLPYSYTALEPHMDARTVEIHHTAHHNSYVTKLNTALADFPEKANLDIATLQHALAGTNPAVINNAGGHYNHTLFWQNMGPIGSSNPAPFGELAAKIDQKFGSFEAFKQQFTAAAVNRFASGWAFLTVKQDGTLEVHNTPGHENPLMDGIGTVHGVPILTCDVWEHAYYLKYQQRRPEFVENWWKIVNWDNVVNNYENYAKKGDAVPFGRTIKKSGCCNIFSMSKIEYEHHLLSNPNLLRNLSIMTCFPFSKVIDYSIKLEQIGHNLLELDVETIGSLMASLD